MLLLYCMHIHRLASYSVRLQEPLLLPPLLYSKSCSYICDKLGGFRSQRLLKRTIHELVVYVAAKHAQVNNEQVYNIRAYLFLVVKSPLEF